MGLSIVQTYSGEEVQMGSKEWASRIRKQAKDLSGDIDTSYMKLAKILYYVHDTKSSEAPYEPLYKAWGFISFKDYAEEELGLKGRKAEYFRNIWQRIEVDLAAMDPAIKKRLIALGWSKLRVLASDGVLTIENAGKWAEFAEGVNFAVLQHQVKQYRDEKKANALKGDPANAALNTEPAMPSVDTVFHQKSFLFTDDQWEVVEAALNKATLMIDNPNAKAGSLFALIASDFLASNMNTGMGHDVRLKYIAKLEQRLGLKLIAIEQNSNEIVYGVTTLENLAEDLTKEHNE